MCPTAHFVTHQYQLACLRHQSNLSLQIFLWCIPCLNQQIESDRNNICASLGLGIDNVSSKLPIVFTIAGVILLLGILGIAWVVYQGGTGIGIDVNLNLIIALVMGVVGLIVVSIIALVITSTVCSI